MTLPLRPALGCNNLSALIRDVPLVEACDSLPGGGLRLKTLFKYPNGSNIDVFLEIAPDLVHPYRLSDYGSTAEFLMHMGLDPWATAKRRRTVAEICASIGVSDENGELAIRFSDDEIPFTSAAVARLGQACIRVAGLHLTKRYRSSGLFREEFEERMLADLPDYEADHETRGRFGSVIRIDFKVAGRRTTSLLQTISAASSSAAHQVANEAFTRWYDLDDRRSDFQFLTIHDSDSSVVRQDDLDRLATLSTVLAFPAQRDAIAEALAA